jgi:histidinol-phosphate aminotransferase
MTADPRPGVRDVDPYVSPQLDVAARLNTNECPHRLPEDYFDRLAEATRDLPLNRYPDAQMRRLRERLAALHGHTPEGTWTANGSNEILTELLLAYGGPGRSALTFEPTYLLHSRLCWLTSTEHRARRLDPPWVLGAADVEAAVGAQPDVVFVCSPNNPTGNSQPLEMTAALARALPGSLVVVDEAYIEFGGTSALPLLTDNANVAVVRTFSKAFAMAGARIGYVLTAPEVVGDLQRVRLPYHMSQLTQAAGLLAIDHHAEAMGILAAIREQRDRIARELAALPGLTVHPSDANFVLFVPPGDAGTLWKELLDRGVLVRDMSAVVPNALRVTAGTEHEVDLFLEALREVLHA